MPLPESAKALTSFISATNDLPQAAWNWNTVSTGTAGTWAGPTITWQDTTSNATYCSASTALSISS